MELFEKTQELKKLKEDMIQTNTEILEILNGFLLQYQTKLIRAGYLGRQEEQKEEIAIYYPELTVPAGFSKEDERYFRNMANVIKHQYALVDEKGKKILVYEDAIFVRANAKRDENKNEVARLVLKKTDIISESVRYIFKIDGEDFYLSRNFSFEDMLEQLLGEQHVDYSDPNAAFNEKSEKDYKKFLESLDVKKEKIIPLKNIIKYKERENQILLPVITVHFEVIQSELDKYHMIRLESPKADVDVGIADANVKYSIKLKVVTTKNEQLLCEKVFEYKEEKSKSKYQNGCTLSEIFKLFK